MSLLRLLAAGKSLIGMRENLSPYRMRTANLLPKFDSPKNPFASVPKTEPANPEPKATPAIVTSAVKPTLAKTEPVKMETISLFDAKPVAAPVPVKAVEAEPVARQPVTAAPIQPKPAVPAKAAPVRKPVPWGEWMKKVNPLTYLPSREPSVKASIRSKGTRTPVQAELSLERVKVVRNDLSDTDLEIIPAKPVGLPDAAGPINHSMTRTEPTTWNRMTSKVLAAGQTMIK